MYTLTYTLLAIAPMLLGMLAMLVGWALGLLLSSPLPVYDEQDEAVDTAVLDAAAAMLFPTWWAVPVELDAAHATPMWAASRLESGPDHTIAHSPSMSARAQGPPPPGG